MGGRWGGSWCVGPGSWPVVSEPVAPSPPRRGGPVRRWRRRAAVVSHAPRSPAACRRGCGGAWCHPSAAGRIAIGRLVVEAPSHHWPFFAVLGGRPRWPARGAVPRGRAWAGDRSRVGPSPCVSPKCRPCALSCQPAAPCEAGAAARALRAGGQVCLGLAAAGAVPHSHRGAPARPACRRGAAVGVAADMIPVHSDPPVFRRRAAMSQFPAAKDYPARATTPAPRRGGEATLGSFAKLTSTCTCVYCDTDL